jgi:hypothetical protein
MSYAYILGNLIGRLLMSFLLVWVVCLLCNRFNWRRAVAQSRRWYAVLAGLALTLLGLGSALVAAGGVK